MLTLYIDADACPVKEEAYRVAARYSLKVVVCAKATMRVPEHELITLVVCPGFEEVDDWIAEQADRRDIVITSDIPWHPDACSRMHWFSTRKVMPSRKTPLLMR